MTALLPRHLPHPSPSRSNPFARPKLNHEPSSFTRSALLPTSPSPHRTLAPFEKVASNSVINGSAGKTRQAWRLLWRGGLEIGKEGWRLDGVAFFALLTFPTTTPSVQPTSNPFDAPIQSSPFPSLPSADTDLCLSLESMRGRKYLQVRGIVDLSDGEVLDGEDVGVQMWYRSISPDAPLVAAYFTTLLCRSETLSSQGRTLIAILIGLGDEGVDSTHSSTLLVYGQRSLPDPDSDVIASTTPLSLRLCVARRKTPPLPPSERKIRPGEPLPRAPLFFPAKAPHRPPPPFVRRSGSGSVSRSFSRTSSVSSIYHPPQPAPSSVCTEPVPPAPVPGRTLGRRGEKRRKADDEEREDEKKRKAGRIVPSRSESEPGPSTMGGTRQMGPPPLVVPGHSPLTMPDDDIFGTRPRKVALQAEDPDRESSTVLGAARPSSVGRGKRVRVPQQVLDNKSAIRKQILLLMAGRGVDREDEQFKDVFGMTTKGAYFAFRARMESGPLAKAEIQEVVDGHLRMYLTGILTDSPSEAERIGVEEDDVATAAEDTKLEVEVKLEKILIGEAYTPGAKALVSVLEESEEESEVEIRIKHEVL